VDGRAELQAGAALLELLGDRARIGDRAGEAVELGDHEREPFVDGRERLLQPGSLAVAAGQALVEVDAVAVDAELEQDLLLGDQVLRCC